MGQQGRARRHGAHHEASSTPASLVCPGQPSMGVWQRTACCVCPFRGVWACLGASVLRLPWRMSACSPCSCSFYLGCLVSFSTTLGVAFVRGSLPAGGSCAGARRKAAGAGNVHVRLGSRPTDSAFPGCLPALPPLQWRKKRMRRLVRGACDCWVALLGWLYVVLRVAVAHCLLGAHQ